MAQSPHVRSPLLCRCGTRLLQSISEQASRTYSFIYTVDSFCLKLVRSMIAKPVKDLFRPMRASLDGQLAFRWDQAAGWLARANRRALKKPSPRHLRSSSGLLKAYRRGREPMLIHAVTKGGSRVPTVREQTDEGTGGQRGDRLTRLKVVSVQASLAVAATRSCCYVRHPRYRRDSRETRELNQPRRTLRGLSHTYW
jgi:hypothetical protein